MPLSSTLKGSGRQLTTFQDLFKITGAVVLVALFYPETLGGIPLVRAFVGHLSSQIDRQMAFVFLLFNVTTAFVFTVALPAGVPG
jgi:phosphate:Na+ symporter